MAKENGKGSKPLKIFLHAVDGVGHMNGLAGMGQALATRGHHVSLLLNSGFANQYTQFGIHEILLQPPPKETKEQIDKPVNVLKEMCELIEKAGFLSSKSSLEKLRAQYEDENDMWATLFPTVVAFDEQIEQLVEKEKPDLFMLDHSLVPTAVQKRNLPWMMVHSAHPFFALQIDDLPPAGSGYPTDSDPSTWTEYRDIADKFYAKMVGAYQVKLNQARNFVPKVPIQNRNGTSFPMSPYLNVYGYPEELDYKDVITIPEKFVRVDALMRKAPGEPFELPKDFVAPGEKLIYLSLGSMGSIDVKLMNRILSIIGKTSHKCIVSKGQRGDEINLPANCWGEVFLPQTKILPLVDLVITHGGNNTTTETFACGKPMIVMPLFADQYDNAQRVQEKGFGVRVEPYSFTEEELLGAIERLLADAQLHQRLEAAKQRMDKSNSKQKACERIEQVVAQFKLEHN